MPCDIRQQFRLGLILRIGYSSKIKSLEQVERLTALTVIIAPPLPTQCVVQPVFNVPTYATSVAVLD